MVDVGVTSRVGCEATELVGEQVLGVAGFVILSDDLHEVVERDLLANASGEKRPSVGRLFGSGDSL